MNELNTQTQQYTQEVSKVMQQAQMDQAAALKQDDMDWAKETAQFASELQNHQAELARYNAELQQEVQVWQLQNLTYEVEKWNKLQLVKFTKFTNEMTNEMNKYNVDAAAYTARFTKAVKDSELLSQDQAVKFQRYDKDMAAHAAEVNAAVQEFQQNAVAKVIEIYKFDRGQALAEFQADSATNLNQFNESVQKANMELQISQNNAQNAQAALQAIMNAETDVAKNNSLQVLQAEVGTFTNKLNNYSAQLSKYQAEVGTKNTEFAASVNKANLRMTDRMNAFNTKFQALQNEIQYKEKILAGLRMDYAQSLGIQPKQGE